MPQNSAVDPFDSPDPSAASASAPSPASRLRARLAARLPTWLHASDVQGLAQLATQGVLGVAGLSESVQGNVYKAVASVFGPVGQRFIDRRPGAGGVNPLGVTGWVYAGVRGVTRLAGGAANAVLQRAAPLLQRADSAPQREAMLAALNGVLGDHLLRTANPLAITTQLRHAGRPLILDRLPLSEVFAEAGSKLLVTVHGLCMNDLQWRATGAAKSAGAAGAAESHADVLARTLGYTPVDLHYNTGLPVAANGAQLSQLLERLVAAWPQPVDELTLLTHSMGGLVARSACLHAEQGGGLLWRARLRNIIFLGTPHHGAPLEQLGSWIDRVLASNPITRPFAAIGQLRSSGINDLRHGAVHTSDRPGAKHPESAGESRQPLDLPKGVNCFAVAGTVTGAPGVVHHRRLARIGQVVGRSTILGDGLVPLASALGRHPDGGEASAFTPYRQWVAEGVNHMALLSRPEVSRQLLAWLSALRSN